MAQLKINQEKFVEGKLSISRRQEGDNNTIVTIGILSIHDYIESIHTIESERYLLVGTEVIQEDFGTNDYNIQYTFKADNLIIKDDYIPEPVKDLIEYKMYYEGEIEELFHGKNFELGLEQYKDTFGIEDEYEEERIDNMIDKLDSDLEDDFDNQEENEL